MHCGWVIKMLNKLKAMYEGCRNTYRFRRTMFVLKTTVAHLLESMAMGSFLFSKIGCVIIANRMVLSGKLKEKKHPPNQLGIFRTLLGDSL
jgi:hypothetical protein